MINMFTKFSNLILSYTHKKTFKILIWKRLEIIIRTDNTKIKENKMSNIKIIP